MSSHFPDIIKIVTIFLKTILKSKKKLKELEIMYQNAVYIFISWYSKTCWFPMKNTNVSRTQGVIKRLIFWIFFG